MPETIRDAVEKRDTATAPTTAADTGALALHPTQSWWTPRQLGALKSLGLEKTPDGDLMVFFHFCQKTGLDPFSKQIYLLEKRSKKDGQWVSAWVIVTGIDGFRVNAQRAADRRGITLEYEETTWYDKDGGKHEVWLDSVPPSAAKVVVVKVMPDGTRLRIPGMAKFASYAGYGTKKDGSRYLMSQWGTMPDHMIEKCAEAFALRRAFANDLGGIYAEEELQGDMTLEHLTRGPESDADESEDQGQAETPPSDVRPAKESLALIAATFREQGLGANTFAKLRHAIVTGLMTPAGTGITDYLAIDKLTPEAAAAAAWTVKEYCDNLSDDYDNDGKPVKGAKMKLREYGEAVIDIIAAAKQEAGGAA
jgi:phage recombination protein Bet